MARTHGSSKTRGAPNGESTAPRTP
jgi:hypothetical protein